MQTLMADFREAGRSLRKQPRFLIIASLTLALGVGAVTAIFSVVNGRCVFAGAQGGFRQPARSHAVGMTLGIR